MLFMSPKEELDRITDSLGAYARRYGEEILTIEFTPEHAQEKINEVYRKLGAVPPTVKPRAVLVEQKQHWERIHHLVSRRQELLFGG